MVTDTGKHSAAHVSSVLPSVCIVFYIMLVCVLCGFITDLFSVFICRIYFSETLSGWLQRLAPLTTEDNYITLHYIYLAAVQNDLHVDATPELQQSCKYINFIK